MSPDGSLPLTVLDHLARHARERPHKPCLVVYEGDRFQVRTYGDLQQAVDCWAVRLASAAAPEGSRVAFLVMGHGTEAYPAFLGAIRAGLVPSFLPPPTVRQRREAWADAHRVVIERTRPAVVATGPEHLDAVSELLGCETPLVTTNPGLRADAVLPPEHPAALNLLQHSSGTTGLKKAVELPLATVDAHIALLADVLKFTSDDIVASWLPLYHDMGLITGFLTPLSLGASVVALDPFAWVADPMSILRAIERHRATLAWFPNFAFAHCARARPATEKFDLSSLRMLMNCSEPCRPETMSRFFEAFGRDGISADRIGACYGLAEAVFAVSQTAPGEELRSLSLDAGALEEGRVVASARGRRRVLSSCGAPLPGIDVVIDAAPGHAGEILVRSPTAASGYAAGGAAVVTPEGFWRTGDVGFLHDGELYVCGRIKEMLILNGRNLYAGDIEAVVSGVPGVKPGRVAAVAMDDEAGGSEALGLLVEPQDGDLDPHARLVLIRAVRAAVRDHFDVAVREVGIGPPGWLAKSTAGKTSRADNLARLKALGAGPPDPGDAARSESDPEGEPGAVRLPLATLVEAVARALQDCFGCDPAAVQADTGPDDVAGWDSLGHAVLIMRLERATGLGLDEAAAAARTVGDLAARLAEASALSRRRAA